MKKIKISLLIVFVGFMFSCNDALDITQPGQVDPNATYATMQGLLKNLNGVYATFGYESEISFNSIFTDEVSIGKGNGGQGITDGTYSFQLNAGSDAPASIWSSNYSTIANCNRFLKGAELTDFAGHEIQYNHMLAQARALRAFAYFQLESYFSTDLTDDSALGVMLFDDVRGIDSPDLPRSTNGEVFQFILADLDYAAANLHDGTDTADVTANGDPYAELYGDDVNRTFYITQNMLHALRARIAIYREDYVTAQSEAQIVIGQYLLTPEATYRNIWDDTLDGECVFKLSRSVNDFKIGSIWASVNSTTTGSPFFEMSRALYNQFAGSYATDIRIITSQNIPDISPGQVLLDKTAQPLPDPNISADYRNEDLLPIGKYSYTESTNLLADAKVFRVSEMYLIKAEAQLGQGNASGASTTIRTLRLARSLAAVPNPGYANLTPAQAWADILKERRKELAYEGHRYLDLKRLRIKAGGVTFDRDPLDCTFNNTCSFDVDDHRWTLPIPTSEISTNTAISGQQNPGY